jgi:cytidine deaminase
MPILLVPAGYNLGGGSGDLHETTVDELLPHSFGPEALELLRTG